MKRLVPIVPLMLFALAPAASANGFKTYHCSTTVWYQPCRDPASPPAPLVHSCPSFQSQSVPDEKNSTGYFENWIRIRTTAGVSCRQARHLLQLSYNGPPAAYGEHWAAVSLHSYYGAVHGGPGYGPANRASSISYSLGVIAPMNAPNLHGIMQQPYYYESSPLVQADVEQLRDCYAFESHLYAGPGGQRWKYPCRTVTTADYGWLTKRF